MSKTTLATALSDLTAHPANVTLKALFASAVASSRSIALWQLPNDGHQQVVIDLANNPSKVKPDLENLGTGFLFAPFSNQEQSIYLNADIFFNTSDFKLLTNDRPDLPELKVRDNLLELIHQKLKQNNNNIFVASSSDNYAPTSEKQFQLLVNESIASIRDGQFHKVVPARR
ncbi:MAG: hypothetical protein ACR2MX_15455, partial [Cyclobacteriaceae bacterium]